MKKKELLSAIAALAFIVVFYWFIGCPIKQFTGIPCPGCGMTRAWLRILHLDLAGAFYYHPLWICPLLFLPVFFWLRPRNGTAYNAVLFAMAALFIVAYILRVMHHSPITQIDLTSGWIYRLIAGLKIGI